MKSFARRSLPFIAICTFCGVAAFAAVRRGDELRAFLDRAVASAPSVAPVAPVARAERAARATAPGKRPSSALADLRARGDAAFEARDPDTALRSTSRIGPQPWPADLPEAFPRPPDARILSDTRQRGDRLLLVDLPTSVDRAARNFDRALRERGYSVARADTRRVRHALHASSASGDAVITFLERGGATRVDSSRISTRGAAGGPVSGSTRGAASGPVAGPTRGAAGGSSLDPVLGG